MGEFFTPLPFLKKGARLLRVLRFQNLNPPPTLISPHRVMKRAASSPASARGSWLIPGLFALALVSLMSSPPARNPHGEPLPLLGSFLEPSVTPTPVLSISPSSSELPAR